MKEPHSSKFSNIWKSTRIFQLKGGMPGGQTPPSYKPAQKCSDKVGKKPSGEKKTECKIISYNQHKKNLAVEKKKLGISENTNSDDSSEEPLSFSKHNRVRPVKMTDVRKLAREQQRQKERLRTNRRVRDKLEKERNKIL